MNIFTVFQLLQIVVGFFMWSLIGQGALALLIGPRRHVNGIYKVLQMMTWPAWRLARILSPRFIADAHMGYIAVLLLAAIRFALYALFYSQGWIPSMTAPVSP